MKRHEPKPDVEEHPHIQMLIDNQNKRATDRERHRERVESLEERDKEIDKREAFGIVEFFCDWCDKDFANYAHKHVEIDWSNPNQRVAYYKSKHDCGNWCIRNITDKHHDTYWNDSRRVARDRGVHQRDIIQEFQTGYQLLFGRRNK